MAISLCKFIQIATLIGAVYTYMPNGFGYSPASQSSSRMMYQHTGVTNSLQCARLCSETWPCNVTQFCEAGMSCTLYTECEDCTSNSLNCPDSEVPETKGFCGLERSLPEPLTCASHRYLVTGPDGVQDSQLKASSYWCQTPTLPGCDIDPEGLSPKYARLVPYTAGQGSSWSAGIGKTNWQWIQVDFQAIKLVTGVIVAGRSLYFSDQYVTAFRVLYNTDCVNDWTAYLNEIGTWKVFAGCSFPQDVVTHCFPDPFPARCFRIYPTTWNGYMSLRFDVLGF